MTTHRSHLRAKQMAILILLARGIRIHEFKGMGKYTLLPIPSSHI